MEPVLIFVSSLQMNAKLADIIQEQLNGLEIESEIINLCELHLSMYNSIQEEREGIPVRVYPVIKKMQQTQHYIIVSPEYNFGVPPILVNFIAWVSRDNENFRELFSLKTIQLATHSGGNGKECMNALRIQFTRLGSIVMPREIICTYKKPLDKESCFAVLKEFVSQIKNEE